MKSFENTLGKTYLPDTFVVHASESDKEKSAFLERIAAETTEATAYVCANQTCSLPVSDEKDLSGLLGKTGPSSRNNG